MTTAYWLSGLYDCSIVIVDKDSGPALHTTLRNTGVAHRPYYLDPQRKRMFAISAGRSYRMWMKLASEFGLPWKEVGTLMVATEEEQVRTLERYAGWAADNGMGEEEYELLDAGGVRKIEPEVSCRGAFFSKTDASTDFAALTTAVWRLAEANGVRFLPWAEVDGVEGGRRGPTLRFSDGRRLDCSLMINAAGGGSLDLAHSMGLARQYANLHFRGEYWVVDEARAPRVNRNIYSVARHAEFNFLDPHFIIRADGRREVGPNAVLVAGPDTYRGIGGLRELLGMVVERPIVPKLRLFSDRAFLSMVSDEWRSSLSKAAMCSRVRALIPTMDKVMLIRRGLAGVRSSLVGDEGFVPEALIVEGEAFMHVLNFNSPGATGAPVFSAQLVRRLEARGCLNGFGAKAHAGRFWDFEDSGL